MPGRGTPWRGVGKGQQDRIGSGEIQDDSIQSEDIKDGTISEVDLDSALQVKVNSGGGGHGIQDEGTPLTQRANLNFKGAGVVASDGIEDTTDVTIAGGGSAHVIRDENIDLPDQPKLNFVGKGVIATNGEGETNVTVKNIYDTIEDEGTPLTQRSELNFVGEGVTASDDGEKTVITIPLGGGGGIDRENVGDPFADYWFYDEFYYPSFGESGFDPERQFPHLEFDLGGGFGSAPSNQIGGVIEIQGGAVTDNIVRVNTCGAGLVAVDGTKKFRVVWRLKKNTATTQAIFGGLTADQNPPASSFPFSSKPDPIIIILDEGTGNYRAYSDDGSTVTNVDTGVAVDTAFHTFEISFDGTSTLLYKIDGATVHTQTTDIPSANMAVMTMSQTSENVAKQIAIDSLFIFGER